MLHWIILILVLSVSKGSIANEIDNSVHKCCGTGFNLKPHTNDNGISYYDCIPSPVENIFGYNLKTNDDVNIPTCDSMEVVVYSNETGTISSNGCIDTLEDHVYGLTCPEPERTVQVHHLFKCCAQEYSYDLNERHCVANTNFLAKFEQFFGDAVVLFKQQVPRCKEDEVFVEYHSRTHSIELVRNGLNVGINADEKSFLEQGTFCVEGALRAHSNEILPAEDGHELIIRSCRPQSICKQMPCIRRCCENDQMMERINGTAVCAPHPENKNIQPKFHKISLPLQTEVQHETEPPGMIVARFF